MAASADPAALPPRRHIPRWAAPPLWAVGVLMAHVILPREIAERGARRGAKIRGGRSLLALPLVGAGAGGIAWTMAQHFTRAPEGWALETTPRYLLARGPYQYSRNPMYLAEILLWLGWALYYRSQRVLASTALFWSFLNFIAVPYEERRLAERFGEAYRDYLSSVPRWL